MGATKFQSVNVSLYIVKKDYSYLCMWDDIKLAGKKQNLDPMWKVLNKEVEFGEPTSFLDHENLRSTQRQCEISKDLFDNLQNQCSNREFQRVEQKNYHSLKIFVFPSWSYDMEGRAKKCVERYCELANKTTQQTLPSIYSLHR